VPRAWSRRDWIHASAAAAATGLVPAGAMAASERVLAESRTSYNHIVVAERGDIRTMYFVVEGTYYIESRLDRAHALSLDLDYTRTMMAGFLVQPRIQRLLMIGFGGGQITNYLFRRFPGIEIDAVDIDGEVIRLAREYFDVPDDSRYRTHAADGRVFVEQAPSDARWDMIMLDAFRGIFVPFHLKTREYYASLLARLAPGGVVVANLHKNTKMYPSDRVTFDAVFPTGYAFTAESGLQTTYVASASETQLGAYDVRAHARELAGSFDFDLLGLAARWYLRRDYQGGDVLHDDFPQGTTPDAAERHNVRCNGPDCPYPTR
jgi:spermidine synthase